MYRETRSSPFGIPASLWRNRTLIWQMTKRDVVGRYRGSVLGIAWSFFNPILMLTVYTFVFSVVFKARWTENGSESKAEFALILFSGLLAHTLFAECINRAPTLILNNANYVKKVVFPLEIFPWVAMASALFHTMTNVLVILTFYYSINLSINWTACLLPIALIPLILVTMGFCWFLSALGVYLRDIGQITSLVTTILMFLSPIFYPITALPEKYQPIMHLNPLTFIIEQVRNILIWGSQPDWAGLGLYTIFSVVVAYIGFFWFQKTRNGFADVV